LFQFIVAKQPKHTLASDSVETRVETKMRFSILRKNAKITRKSHENFAKRNENFIFAVREIFAKISLRKLTLIAESLLMWNTWGMGHQTEYCLLE
jgi:hypothetical protein